MSWTKIMTSSLKRPTVANFADIIKIASVFIKATL